MIKKVVFLGSKSIGLECLKILYDNQLKYNYEIIGVLTDQKSEGIKHYSLKNNLKLLSSLDEYLSLSNINITFSIPQSSEVGGRGSGSVTSIPAAAISPFFNAVTKSLSITHAPRATLIR